ncbi:twin-arginine translocation signal domain-containing protein [Desulfocurvibacter africanus]|uniref:twin-arginine translocation signal domain-containing protein n=1 Tax=Desulfocurvibacter africanus TaxID=873 RepID=UPI0004124E9F|nr:twin-arginine translocation signal domain-containing protein [Desulfocurvibacter africanus]
MSDSNNPINRRDFIKGAALGVGLGAFGAMGVYSYSPWRKAHLAKVERKLTDFGVCRGVKATVISETSWFDNAMLMGDIKAAGGLLVDQYTYNWPPFGDGTGLGKGSYESGIAQIKSLLPGRLEEAWEITRQKSVHPENSGGFAALIEVEDMDGKVHKYLLDSGWSYQWMDECFKREGIDKMLASGEIEALIISHEHFDHFWGLPVTLKYAPGIKIYIPDTFYPSGLQYIVDAGHKGELIKVSKGLRPIMPGMASYVFDIPIICKVFGEQSLYFNVADLGLVSITGCCHQGIILFADTAYKELKYERDQFHGLYGGLHISPFDDWDPKYDDLVIGLKKWNIEKVGCNHCTGLVTAKKFIDVGYPVIKGTARFRTKDEAYLGNGDTIEFRKA